MLLMEDEKTAVNADGWMPGENAGRALRYTDHWPQGVAMLVVNVVLSLFRLPRDLLRSISERMYPGQGAVGRVSDIAAGLLQITSSSIWKVFVSMRSNSWLLLQQSTAQPEPEALSDSDKNATTLRRMARVALGVRQAHGGEDQYAEWLCRLQLEGLEVGDKYHTKEHYRDTIYLAARAVQCLDEDDRQQPLGGLGIPSNFALLVDGVPVGGMNARNGTVEVICLHYVSPHTGVLHARFVTWTVLDSGHGGRAMAASVLRAMQAPPLAMGPRAMQAGLSLVGGDGAVVRGGTVRKSRPGTSACEFIWSAAHPELELITEDDPVILALLQVGDGKETMKARVADSSRLWYSTEWDKLHREDKRMLRSIHKCPLADELFDVARLMDAMFGFGSGKQLLRTAADMTDTIIYKGALPGVTRKGVSLVKEPGNLLENLAAYSVGLRGKVALKREDGPGSHKISILTQAGRRLTSVDLVGFAALFRDLVEKTMVPWWLDAQRNSLEPWVLNRKRNAVERKLVEFRGLAATLRRVLRMLVLLRSHVPLEDLRRLIFAFGCARPSHFFIDETGNEFRKGFRWKPARPLVAKGMSFGRAFPSFWRPGPQLFFFEYALI
jgi:hypothetical protein